jgi:hypothetical protein
VTRNGRTAILWTTYYLSQFSGYALTPVFAGTFGSALAAATVL